MIERIVSNRITAVAFVAMVGLIGGAALLRSPPPPPEPLVPAPDTRRPSPSHGKGSSSGLDPHGVLPPGHLPIHPDSSTTGRSQPPSPEESVVLTWTAPAGWQQAPNPTTMRLATYKIPRVGQDPEDAELSVSRAGGSTEANIERWVGQFDGARKDTRSTRTIRGLKVTTVEVSGAYQGMGMGGPGGKKPGWSLLGAVVETPGSSYFFKMVGPTATVHSARGSFEQLLDSLTPQ
ncbi:MAG: hypothetical protein NZX77_17190 [Polyangiaceae bacterium]|nr:hypothetical protein [Polyangiaceae bacterium]